MRGPYHRRRHYAELDVEMDIFAKVRNTHLFLSLQRKLYTANTELPYSVPAAVLTALVITLSMPNGFPHHHRLRQDRPNSKGVFSRESLQRLDFFGTALLLLSNVLLVAALEEAGVLFAWKSAYVCMTHTMLPFPLF